MSLTSSGLYGQDWNSICSICIQDSHPAMFIRDCLSLRNERAQLISQNDCVLISLCMRLIRDSLLSPAAGQPLFLSPRFTYESFLGGSLMESQSGLFEVEMMLLDRVFRDASHVGSHTPLLWCSLAALASFLGDQFPQMREWSPDVAVKQDQHRIRLQQVRSLIPQTSGEKFSRVLERLSDKVTPGALPAIRRYTSKKDNADLVDAALACLRARDQSHSVFDTIVFLAQLVGVEALVDEPLICEAAASALKATLLSAGGGRVSLALIAMDLLHIVRRCDSSSSFALVGGWLCEILRSARHSPELGTGESLALYCVATLLNYCPECDCSTELTTLFRRLAFPALGALADRLFSTDTEQKEPVAVFEDRVLIQAFVAAPVSLITDAGATLSLLRTALSLQATDMSQPCVAATITRALDAGSQAVREDAAFLPALARCFGADDSAVSEYDLEERTAPSMQAAVVALLERVGAAVTRAAEPVGALVAAIEATPSERVMSPGLLAAPRADDLRAAAAAGRRSVTTMLTSARGFIEAVLGRSRLSLDRARGLSETLLAVTLPAFQGEFLTLSSAALASLSSTTDSSEAAAHVASLIADNASTQTLVHEVLLAAVRERGDILESRTDDVLAALRTIATVSLQRGAMAALAGSLSSVPLGLQSLLSLCLAPPGDIPTACAEELVSAASLALTALLSHEDDPLPALAPLLEDLRGDVTERALRAALAAPDAEALERALLLVHSLAQRPAAPGPQSRLAVLAAALVRRLAETQDTSGDAAALYDVGLASLDAILSAAPTFEPETCDGLLALAPGLDALVSSALIPGFALLQHLLRDSGHSPLFDWLDPAVAGLRAVCRWTRFRPGDRGEEAAQTLLAFADALNAGVDPLFDLIGDAGVARLLAALAAALEAAVAVCPGICQRVLVHMGRLLTLADSRFEVAAAAARQLQSATRAAPADEQLRQHRNTGTRWVDVAQAALQTLARMPEHRAPGQEPELVDGCTALLAGYADLVHTRAGCIPTAVTRCPSNAALALASLCAGLGSRARASVCESAAAAASDITHVMATSSRVSAYHREVVSPLIRALPLLPITSADARALVAGLELLRSTYRDFAERLACLQREIATLVSGLDQWGLAAPLVRTPEFAAIAGPQSHV